MSDGEFSDIQIFQHSGKGIPLFMTCHKNCLQADYLLGPGPRLIKKEFTGPRSHKGAKRWSRRAVRPTRGTGVSFLENKPAG
jgi:hypothetical protein